MQAMRMFLREGEGGVEAPGLELAVRLVGLCYQLGGDNLSVLSAVTSLPADKN